MSNHVSLANQGRLYGQPYIPAHAQLKQGCSLVNVPLLALYRGFFRSWWLEMGRFRTYVFLSTGCWVPGKCCKWGLFRVRRWSFRTLYTDCFCNSAYQNPECSASCQWYCYLFYIIIIWTFGRLRAIYHEWDTYLGHCVHGYVHHAKTSYRAPLMYTGDISFMLYNTNYSILDQCHCHGFRYAFCLHDDTLPPVTRVWYGRTTKWNIDRLWIALHNSTVASGYASSCANHEAMVNGILCHKILSAVEFICSGEGTLCIDNLTVFQDQTVCGTLVGSIGVFSHLMPLILFYSRWSP